jgi:trehalose 6-phosphate phosphatase
VEADALEVIRSRRPEAGVLVDFDGTLSEIAPTPEEARPVPGAGRALAALARSFATVAVVSGRRAAEVAALLGHPAGVRCFGLYGLEDDRGPVDRAAVGLVDRIEGLLPEVEQAVAGVPGARIEPKGLQVAVHYRGTADPEWARRTLADRLRAVAAPAGLRVLEGKKVLELAPDGGPTKGDVVERLARDLGLRAVLYAGDDLADRNAFAAVDRLRAGGVDGVKVAVRSAETPEDLTAAADVVVEGPVGLVDLLMWLSRR